MQDESGYFDKSPRVTPTPLNFSSIKDEATAPVEKFNSGSKTQDRNQASQGMSFTAAAAQKPQIANEGEKTVRQFSAISPMCQHESNKKPRM